MIPSLITYNYSIIAYTTPSVQNAEMQLKDWLPLIFSVLVVIIGAFLTYDRNITIDEKKRRYELKKQAYLELLSALIEAEKELDEFKNNPAYREESDKNLDYIISLIEYKFLLCGGSTDVYNIIDKRLLKLHVFDNSKEADKIIREELVPAMKKDLAKVEKSWWQFWRRG